MNENKLERCQVCNNEPTVKVITDSESILARVVCTRCGLKNEIKIRKVNNEDPNKAVIAVKDEWNKRRKMEKQERSRNIFNGMMAGVKKDLINLAKKHPKKNNKGVVFKGDDEKIYMVRCPKCGLENYALNVASGQCSWCGYIAKEEDIDL